MADPLAMAELCKAEAGFELSACAGEYSFALLTSTVELG